MTEEILTALGYDPELCGPDPVAWARGFRERFEIVTEARDVAERENETLRKEHASLCERLKRIADISECDAGDYAALHRDLRAANDLLKRIARAVGNAAILIPEGPLDVRVKWALAFAATTRDARGNLQAREGRALAILREHGIEASDVVSGLEQLFDGEGFGEALAAAFRAGREMEARRRVGEAA